MKQSVLVLLSVYSSSNNPTIATKQELPKYKAVPTPTYHKDTLKKENNQQLSRSASPLVNKVLESLRIKLSKPNTSFLDEIETGVLLNCVSFECFVFIPFASTVLSNKFWRTSKYFTPLSSFANLSTRARSIHQTSFLNLGKALILFNFCVACVNLVYEVFVCKNSLTFDGDSFSQDIF